MRYAFLLLPLLAVSCGTPNNIVPENHREQKMFAFLEKFDRFDYNGDGKLTKKEVRQGLRESDVHGITDAEIDKGFAEFDTDKDGAISFAEAQGGMRREFSDR
ncbi:MAG: EF-hand domain-containing protein [Luteolibacter sp.]